MRRRVGFERLGCGVWGKLTRKKKKKGEKWQI